MSQNSVTGINVFTTSHLSPWIIFLDDMRLISGVFTSLAKDKINIDMINKSISYKGNINISFTLSSKID